ncbi:MAG: thioesterase family protein [Sphingomonadaceae bacterium]|nr:thioesterase family protein [Sphingomonadaceae bacterium]
MAVSAPARDDDPFALSDAGAGRYVAHVERRLCTGRPESYFMFGGSGLALAARAVERRTGGPLRWLTLQFIAPTLIGARLELTVERLTGGRVAQLSLNGAVGDEITLRGLAATGSRSSGAPDLMAARMPDVPPPDDCPIIRAHNAIEQDVHQLLELRLVRGRFGIFSKAPRSADSRVLVWMRPTYGDVDASALALMADFVGSTMSNAVGLRGGAGSLDNTIRVIGLPTTPWVLCDIAIPAIADGIGHGRVDLFAEDGALLALASQTFIARLHPAQALGSQ